MKIKLKPQSESAIVSAICAYLKAKNYFFWRQNNAGIYDAKRNAYRTNKNTMKGVPDIFLMRSNGLGATIYGIEVKAPDGSLSIEQKEFSQKFIDNGGSYLVIRSLDDLIRAGF